MVHFLLIRRTINGLSFGEWECYKDTLPELPLDEYFSI